jgi:type IV secretory pathway TrbL component
MFWIIGRLRVVQSQFRKILFRNRMIADTGTLTTVLDGFLSVLKVGKADVGSQAFSLLTILATIELLMASLWWALTGQDALVGLIKKLLSVGFFVFIITNYDNLLHVVVDGFIQTGKLAGAKWWRIVHLVERSLLNRRSRLHSGAANF